MLSLRATLTAAGAALLVALASCSMPGAPAAPPDPATEAVNALPACTATVTTFDEGANPPCNPVDHTADGSGLDSQRLDMLIPLANAGPTDTHPAETARCQGNTPATGYGGTPAGFNLQTMKLTCRQVDVWLVWSRLIAPASVAA